ncbi:hypothetical protein J6590_024650 [Homalodisca vitripennis]|nr:hypothetical protein J6590_024650 [Homalodisca vitripennis]
MRQYDGDGPPTRDSSRSGHDGLSGSGRPVAQFSPTLHLAVTDASRGFGVEPVVLFDRRRILHSALCFVLLVFLCSCLSFVTIYESHFKERP